jgi:Family of unknown function (DUF6653)
MGSTDTSSQPKRTADSRVAQLFGLMGEHWMRHANPISVWTRFTVLSLLALSIWSRDWIGWFSLIPVVLSLVWMMLNPLLFPRPRSTKNWASKGVFGERIYADRNAVEIPKQFKSRVPDVANALAAIGLILLAYGLITLRVLPVVAGVFIANLAKLWYLDRMVLLFEDMKGRSAEYAGWEY